MKQIYLGDSYDIVKRFWAQSLRSIAPLYAHARFIPRALRQEYTAMTTIPILDLEEGKPDSPFGILLDPHTGIPLPSESGFTQTTAAHAPLDLIIKVVVESAPQYLICFDQSHRRVKNYSRELQRRKKMDYLQERGLSAFYYVSHAPFLFVSKNFDSISVILARMSLIGLPSRRFEVGNLQSTTG